MATSEASQAGTPRAKATARAPGARPQAPLLAYVLHSHDWSESSLIVELFTRERGRVVVAAKGAKRPTSNFRPVLLPFQPLHVQLGKTPADEQAEVLALRSAEWAGGQPLLPASALMQGFYVNELLLKLLARQDPHPGLFDAYAETVASLASTAQEAVVLRAFELILLREMGVLPDLSFATQDAQALHSDQRYTLQVDRGIVRAAQGPSGPQWVTLEAALAHGSARAVQHACSGIAGLLRVPLRELLHYHLGGARLRTRQVWQGVQKLSARTQPLAP